MNILVMNLKEKIVWTKKEKKTYYVNVHFDVVVPVKVVATSEEEAISEAKEIADVDNYDDVTLSDACVTDVE